MEEFETMEEFIEDNTEEISERPIDVITEEIKFYKNTAGAAILEIGKRLNEAKAMLNHGEWGEWLREKVDFSEATAQRFMRLANEYSNPSPVTDLGVSKALILLALPPVEREEFAAEKHTINGEEKTASEMTKKELEKAIQEKKEADAVIEQLKEKLEQAEEAQNETDALLEEAKEEIEQLKKMEKPTVSSEQVSEIKKEAESEVQKKIEALNKKIDKLTEAKTKAETEKKDIEDKIEAIKNDYETALKSKDSQKEALQGKITELTAQLNMNNSSAITEFKVYFENAQTNINKMLEIIQKAEAETGEKLKAALSTLSEQMKEV